VDWFSRSHSFSKSLFLSLAMSPVVSLGLVIGSGSVCCSVLPCVAVCCSVLQCVATSSALSPVVSLGLVTGLGSVSWSRFLTGELSFSEWV